MKTLAVILFIASAALNIGFLTGCQSLHDAVYGSPCEFVPSAPKQDETADTTFPQGAYGACEAGR